MTENLLEKRTILWQIVHTKLSAQSQQSALKDIQQTSKLAKTDRQTPRNIETAYQRVNNCVPET